MPPRESTATSVVPPPISTTMEPVGSVTGRPAPIAAAIGSSISQTLLAPADSADSWMARRSTAVEPDGHADDDLRPGERPAVVMHLADEMLDHLFRDLEIGDHAVAQGADCLDISRGAAQHQLGFVADSQNVFFAAIVGDGDDGGFVEDDSTAFDVHKRVRRPQVDRHIGREHAHQLRKHPIPPVLLRPQGTRSTDPHRSCRRLPEDAGRPSPLQSRTAFGGGRLMRHGTGDRVRNAKETAGFTTQQVGLRWPLCFYPPLANQHKSEIGARVAARANHSIGSRTLADKIQ